MTPADLHAAVAHVREHGTAAENARLHYLLTGVARFSESQSAAESSEPQSVADSPNRNPPNAATAVGRRPGRRSTAPSMPPASS